MKKLFYILGLFLFSSAIASAQLPGMQIYPLLNSPVPLSITYTDTSFQNTPLTTYTYTSRAIGTAAANRYIVVGVGQATAAINAVVSMTIGGISASQIVFDTNGVNGRTDLWIAPVPTGTTATIVITFAGSVTRCGIGVWAIYGGSNTARATGAGHANPAVASLNIPAGGVVIGFTQNGNFSFTSTGSTVLTSRFTTTMSTGSAIGGFDATSNIPISPASLGITYGTTTAAVDSGVFAVFGP